MIYTTIKQLYFLLLPVTDLAGNPFSQKCVIERSFRHFVLPRLELQQQHLVSSCRGSSFSLISSRVKSLAIAIFQETISMWSNYSKPLRRRVISCGPLDKHLLKNSTPTTAMALFFGKAWFSERQFRPQQRLIVNQNKAFSGRDDSSTT